MADHIIVEYFDDIMPTLGSLIRVPFIGSADRWAQVERLDRVEDGVVRVLAYMVRPAMSALAG